MVRIRGGSFRHRRADCYNALGTGDRAAKIAGKSVSEDEDTEPNDVQRSVQTGLPAPADHTSAQAPPGKRMQLCNKEQVPHGHLRTPGPTDSRFTMVSDGTAKIDGKWVSEDEDKDGNDRQRSLKSTISSPPDHTSSRALSTSRMQLCNKEQVPQAQLRTPGSTMTDIRIQEAPTRSTNSRFTIVRKCSDRTARIGGKRLWEGGDKQGNDVQSSIRPGISSQSHHTSAQAPSTNRMQVCNKEQVPQGQLRTLGHTMQAIQIPEPQWRSTNSRFTMVAECSDRTARIRGKLISEAGDMEGNYFQGSLQSGISSPPDYTAAQASPGSTMQPCNKEQVAQHQLRTPGPTMMTIQIPDAQTGSTNQGFTMVGERSEGSARICGNLVSEDGHKEANNVQRSFQSGIFSPAYHTSTQAPPGKTIMQPCNKEQVPQGQPRNPGPTKQVIQIPEPQWRSTNSKFTMVAECSDGTARIGGGRVLEDGDKEGNAVQRSLQSGMSSQLDHTSAQAPSGKTIQLPNREQEAQGQLRTCGLTKTENASGSSSRLNTSMVNQLLTKIDSLESLNNILLIAITNRKVLLHTALLGRGRFEVQVEMGLPDEKGRFRIPQIHSSQMQQGCFLSEDVDLTSLAARTENFSGAQIEGLVRSATSFALSRLVDSDDPNKPIEGSMTVTLSDFVRALDEVKLASATDLPTFERFRVNTMLDCGPNNNRVQNSGKVLVDAVKTSEKIHLISCLLDGPGGSGKTALATTVGLHGQFPFIKMISAGSMVGLSETKKSELIRKVFEDAYKSPVSLIIIDDIERIIGYVEVGHKFSNLILQDLITLIKRHPPKPTKLLIIGTTSMKEIMRALHILSAFDVSIPVPTLSPSEIRNVLLTLDVFESEEEVEKAVNVLGGNVPIKKLLMLIEMSKSGGSNGGLSRKIDLQRFQECYNDLV